MADHQPYAMDNWNIGIPRRPVSYHPEAALNEEDHQESPVMDIMLSELNDSDSVWKQNNAFRYLDHGSEEEGMAGRKTPTDDAFDWLGGGDAGASSTHTREWEQFVQEDHTNDVFGGQYVFFPCLELEEHVQEEQPEEPMDIGAEEAVEGATEREAPNAVLMDAQVGDQEISEPMDKAMDLPQVQEMEIDHDAMELEAEPIEEDVQGPPAPIQEALSLDMKAALDAPLVDDPDSNDPDFPVEMVEAAPVPDVQEEEPASLPISAPASSSLPAAIPVPAAQDPSTAETPASGPTPTPAPAPASSPLAAPVPASSSSQLSATTPELVAPAPSPAETPASGSIPTPAPAPASPPLPDPAFSTLPDPASSPLPASTATPAETPALVPVQIPSPTDDDYEPAEENRPAIRYAERMIEYVLIRSGVPCGPDSDDDFDPLVPAPDPHARRIFSGRRWRGRPFKKRSKKGAAHVPDAPAPPTPAPTPLAVAPTPSAHVAPAAPTIVPAPTLIAPTPPAPASTLATIALAPQLAWQPWVPAGNKSLNTAKTLIPKVAAPKKTKAAAPKKAPRRRQTQAEIREELQRKEREEKKKKDQQRRERELRAQKLAAKRMEMEAQSKKEQQSRERDERAKRLPAKRKAAQDLLDAKRMKKN